MEAVEKLFNRWALEGQDVEAARGHAFAALQVLDDFTWQPTDAFLDIGCGNGYTIRHVGPRLPKGYAIGIDLAPNMVAKAWRMTPIIGPTEFILADFMAWDPGRLRFDKIFSMEAFYYLPDVAAAIRKAATLLKPGGAFACIVDFYAENAASAEWPSCTHCGVPMQRHSRAKWSAMFHAAGLVDVAQRQILYPEVLATAEWQTTVGSLVTIGRRPAGSQHRL